MALYGPKPPTPLGPDTVVASQSGTNSPANPNFFAIPHYDLAADDLNSNDEGMDIDEEPLQVLIDGRQYHHTTVDVNAS